MARGGGDGVFIRHSGQEGAVGVERDGGGGPVEAVFVEGCGRVGWEGLQREGAGVCGVEVCECGLGRLQDKVDGVGSGI